MQSAFGVAASALTASEHNGFFFYSRSGGDLTRLELKFDVRVPVFTLETDSGAFGVAPVGVSWMAPRWSFEREKTSEEDQRPFPRHVLFRGSPQSTAPAAKEMSDLRFVYSPRRTN